ncbi:exosome complex component RRP46 [Geosmithia morbida]|uniref:Exosome complex component RRP46 n=1 Tax=Geosmithia morbida TaxID=1094350 RepID=A0A9P5D5F3_9HYPO|nr:exosome complex component RRP46 [Geosmithia morbida]KAF4122434.1 exosome complex component RRP46 [Geosmithia morbida]
MPHDLPSAELARLEKADGSATFSYQGYSIISAVNGPIEAPRRDENAFEALVDVNIRPAAGVGGTAERQLESILQSALRHVIPVRDFPRSMIQVTLQVVQTPENAYENTKVVQAQADLALIPALLHSAILGLLTAAVPLKTIATATLLAVPSSGDGAGAGAATIDPDPVQASQAKSVHVLGFTSDGELLLAESQGSFSPDEWREVLRTGEQVCCRKKDTVMSDEPESTSIQDFIRSAMETKVAKDLHWK